MTPEPKGTLNKCPNCGGLSAIFATPCCTKNPQCTWSRCKCGHTYDRVTGNHFQTVNSLKDNT